MLANLWLPYMVNFTWLGAGYCCILLNILCFVLGCSWVTWQKSDSSGFSVLFGRAGAAFTVGRIHPATEEIPFWVLNPMFSIITRFPLWFVRTWTIHRPVRTLGVVLPAPFWWIFPPSMVNIFISMSSLVLGIPKFTTLSPWSSKTIVSSSVTSPYIATWKLAPESKLGKGLALFVSLLLGITVLCGLLSNVQSLIYILSGFFNNLFFNYISFRCTT